MNDSPRQALRRLVAKYGKDLGGNARRCEGLLKDYCGEYRREINVLTSAVEERIPLDLLAAGNAVPRELLLSKLAKRLEDNLGLTAEAARWAVDSWGLALGIANEKEIAAREKRQNDVSPAPVSEQNRPLPGDSEIRLPHQNRQSRIFPPPATNAPPEPSPQVYPPLAKAPADSSAPASPASPPSPRKSNFPQNSPQNLPPPNTTAAHPAARKYFRRFLGCLFVLLLLIIASVALIFGVPYAISVMRETQQQKSDTPRFPGR